MEPTIAELDNMILAGTPQFGSREDICPSMSWNRLEKIKKKLTNAINPNVIHGLSLLLPSYKNDKKFYYMASLQVEDVERIPIDFFIKILPHSKYAIFDIPDGDHAKMFEAYRYAYEEWLPDSSYEEAWPYNFESVNTTDGSIKVHIPIK
jgi:AraC family transcriptional regulator